MKRLVLTFAALVLLAAGCSSTSLSSPAAATVNGTDITISSLYSDLDALASDEGIRASFEQNGTPVYGSDDKTYSTTFAAGWLTQLIQAELVEQQLASLGGTPTADEMAQAKQQIAQSAATLPADFVERLTDSTANQLALQRVIEEQAPPQPVTDEEVRAYYDQNIDATMQQIGGEVACVSHITAVFDPTGQGSTPTPEQQAAARQAIDQVASRLSAGEDFTTVADEFGQQSGGPVSGGDLGCLPRNGGQVPPALEDAAYSLALGEVSDVIETEIGYHLIVVRSRGVLPFEEASATIRQQLEQNKGSATQQAATDFVQAATITVDPRFGTFDSVRAEVVPPEGPTSPSTTTPLVDQLQGTSGPDEPQPTTDSGTP